MEVSDKLVRFGKVLNVVGKVLAALCLLGALGALITAIVVILIPEETISQFLKQIELTSDIGLFVPGTTLGSFLPVAAMKGIKLGLVFAIMTAFLYCVVGAIVLFILSALFNSTATKGSPFLPENVKRLKIIGVVLIVVSLLLGLQNLIFAFCFLALAYVFQYGTALQQQADETL